MVDDKCCEPGTVWSAAEPRGKEIEIGTYRAYLSETSGKKPTAAVLLIHDVFGWETKNLRVYADRFADAGFLTIVPDFFRGTARKPDAPRDMDKTMKWLADFPHEETLASIKKVVAEMRSTYSVKSVGAEGFCWGGKHVVALLADNSIKSGVVAHGSRITVEDVEALQGPVLFLFSDNDRMIPTELREQFEGILKQKSASFPAEGVFYPGQAHGWAIRGDDKDEKVAEAALDAFARAAAWFKKTL